MSAARLIATVGLSLLVLGFPLPVLAGAEGQNAEEVSLPSTLVTEGAMPGTEVEAMFMASKSSMERMYELALSSVQYAPVPWFGIKLALPLDIRDPREGPAVAGIGDVSLSGKYAALMLPAQQLALAGGLKLTFPTGSERRDLGGMFAFTPFLAAGKGFGPFSLQADAAYSWQLNRPRRIEPEMEGEEPVRPDKEQGVTANLAATYSPVERLGLILELNSVMVVRGDEELKERMQLYLTLGVSVEPAKGWNLRAGIQFPVTSAKEFDSNVIVILTKGF